MSKSIVVLGTQWGDEGKGKIVDLLTGDHDVIVRYNGGANAGHTVVVGEALLTQVMKDGGETQTKLRVGDHVVIPPHVPHLYEFTKDTLMTESWTHREPDADRAQCEFEAWFHKKLRARIDTRSTVRDG